MVTTGRKMPPPAQVSPGITTPRSIAQAASWRWRFASRDALVRLYPVDVVPV